MREVMGLLGRFYRGFIVLEKMESMTWDELEPWYDIYELQSTEEEIVSELSHDKDGKKKELPPPDKIRERTLERIEERKQKAEKRRKLLMDKAREEKEDDGR
jgi:hypothetical protein